MKAKQVIIARRDLNMPAGKLAAQVAHASMLVFSQDLYDIDHLSDNFGERVRMIHLLENRPKELVSVLKFWFGNLLYTKIVLACNSKEELLEMHQKAEDAGLLTALIKDHGLTVFKEPTYTCVGIGPDLSEKIDLVTGHLKLYK